MLHVNRIMFPTDLSSGVARAWRVISYFGEMWEAEVFAVQVDTSVDANEPIQTTDEGALARTVEEITAADVRVRGIRAIAPTVTGGILHVAQELDMDILAMATHGHGGVRRLLIGSVTDEVVRSAPCPVITVRSRPSDVAQFSGLTRVLVPVDFSQHSWISLVHAVHIAEQCGAHLELLHIVEQRAMPRVYDRGAASLSLKTIKQRAVETIEKMVHEDLKFKRAAVHVKMGYASEDIVQWANENNSDLVVISSHGRSSIERILLGSVTQRVVRLAQCPVLTLKSYGTSLLADPPSDTGWPLSGEGQPTEEST